MSRGRYSSDLMVEDGDDAPLAKRFLASCYTFVIVVCTFSISVALLNITKWIYVTYGFKFPLFLTATHMAASYVMAGVMIFGLNLVPARRILTFKEQVFTVAPFSLLGASSIACGNMSLVYLYPSFHEMIQNTTPFWTVVCSTILIGARFNNAAYLALIPVTFGSSLCAAGEQSNFAIIGLFFSIFAAVFRAVRAIVQANLMRGQEPLDSVTLLFYAAPFNLGLFLTGSLMIEGIQPWVEIFQVPFMGQLFIGGAAMVAAMYNLFAFLLVGHMGAVGSMVMGNLKTPTIIVTSTIIFGNSCTMMQVVGFIVATTGAYCYQTYGQEVKCASNSAMSYNIPQSVGRKIDMDEELGEFTGEDTNEMLEKV